MNTEKFIVRLSDETVAPFTWQRGIHTIKRNLEIRMPGNSHVRFGVGAGVQFPGLHHTDDARKN